MKTRKVVWFICGIFWIMLISSGVYLMLESEFIILGTFITGFGMSGLFGTFKVYLEGEE